MIIIYILPFLLNILMLYTNIFMHIIITSARITKTNRKQWTLNIEQIAFQKCVFFNIIYHYCHSRCIHNYYNCLLWLCSSAIEIITKISLIPIGPLHSGLLSPRSQLQSYPKSIAFEILDSDQLESQHHRHPLP